MAERLGRWRPLTVLHAPGGAGKTTLAAQWAADARAAGDHVGWYDAAAGGSDPQELLAGLAGPGERAVLVIDRAEALGVDRLLALADQVRRSPDRHLVLCLRADHAIVLRLRTEVETELVTAADLALDAAEVEVLVGAAAAPEVLAWTGGHAGTVVAGLPGPGEPGGWSRERARAALGVRLDELGDDAVGVGLLAALGTAPVGSALLTSVLTGLGGDPMGAFEQVASVEVGAVGLRLSVTPALQDALAAVPAADLPAAALAAVVRLRWWELLRADPVRLAALAGALGEGGGGSVAAQLRAEGLVGTEADPVVARVPIDLEACAVRIAAGRRRGDLRAAVDAVRRGEALLREGPDDPDALRSFALHAGLAALDTGDLASARGWWLRAHRATTGGDGEAAALLALIAAVEGDHEAVAAWEPLAGDTEALRLVRAIAELDAGDLRAAGRWLGGATAGDGDLWYLAAGVRAHLALLTPARPEALQVLRRQRAAQAELAPAGSMARCVLSVAEVDLLLASGRATEAAVLLEGLPDSAAARLLRGRLALMTDDLPTAAAELAAVAHPPATLRRLRMEALLLTIETHRRAGRTAAARYAADQLALRAPWPRLGDLVPGGPVYPASAEVVRLTTRERELLVLLRGPLPRDSIASTLYVSTNTVKTQLQGLYRKLGVATREEAVERAFTLGLLD